MEEDIKLEKLIETSPNPISIKGTEIVMISNEKLYMQNI